MVLSRGPVSHEGRFAVVTDVEAGCGGRVDVAAWVNSRADEQHDAHGQVAWSWHPDADAKFALMLSHRAGDGGQKARRTRETAYKRENRRAGKAGLSRLSLW